MNELIIVLMLSLLAIAYTYYRTIKSSISPDRKLTVYIISIIIPVLGLILFFFFNRRHTRAQAQST